MLTGNLILSVALLTIKSPFVVTGDKLLNPVVLLFAFVPPLANAKVFTTPVVKSRELAAEVTRPFASIVTAPA